MDRILQPTARIASALLISCLIKSTTAVLVLSELQPITGFPAKCEAAYNVPIPACPNAASFMDAGSTTGCDKTCFVALNGAALRIQQACQTAAAYGDTVISHAFSSDLSVYLCGNQFGDGSNTATATNVGETPVAPIPSLTSSRSKQVTPSSTMVPTPSATPVATSTVVVPSTTSGPFISSATNNPISSTSTSPNTTPSATHATTITTVVKSSTSTKTSAAPKTSRYDSTPFDQGVHPNTGVKALKSNTGFLALISSCTAISITWLLTI